MSKHKQTQDKLKRLELVKRSWAMHDGLLAIYGDYSESYDLEKATKNSTVLLMLEHITSEYLQISELIQEIFVQEIYDRTGKKPPPSL